MDSLAGLTRQLKSVSGLAELVKTMKVMAAVQMRQLARSSEALDACMENLENGLQVVLRQLPEQPARAESQGTVLTVVFGSDHGLCGPFHQHLLEALVASGPVTPLLCVGSRLAESAQEFGLKVESVFSAPTSSAALASVAEQLLLQLQPLPDRVVLFYQRTQDGSSRPQAETLWPLEAEWLGQLRRRPWPSRSRPMCWGEPAAALQWLLEERLQFACQRALSHSLASENQARLLTMQAAEKNLEELACSLQEHLRGRRQNAVTEELLDVISGFEVLTSGGGGG